MREKREIYCTQDTLQYLQSSGDDARARGRDKALEGGYGDKEV